MSDKIEAVIAKFQHAVIQNQLGTLIHHFHHKHQIDEATLYTIAAAEIEASIDPTRPHADALKRILFGEKMTVKALLNMRMEQKSKTIRANRHKKSFRKRAVVYASNTH